MESLQQKEKKPANSSHRKQPQQRVTTAEIHVSNNNKIKYKINTQNQIMPANNNNARSKSKQRVAIVTNPEWSTNTSNDRIPPYNSLADPYNPLRKSATFLKMCMTVGSPHSTSSAANEREGQGRLKSPRSSQHEIAKNNKGALVVVQRSVVVKGSDATVTKKPMKKKKKKKTFVFDDSEWLLGEEDFEDQPIDFSTAAPFRSSSSHSSHHTYTSSSFTAGYGGAPRHSLMNSGYRFGDVGGAAASRTASLGWANENQVITNETGYESTAGLNGGSSSAAGGGVGLMSPSIQQLMIRHSHRLSLAAVGSSNKNKNNSKDVPLTTADTAPSNGPASANTGTANASAVRPQSSDAETKDSPRPSDHDDEHQKKLSPPPPLQPEPSSSSSGRPQPQQQPHHRGVARSSVVFTAYNTSGAVDYSRGAVAGVLAAELAQRELRYVGEAEGVEEVGPQTGKEGIPPNNEMIDTNTGDPNAAWQRDQRAPAATIILSVARSSIIGISALPQQQHQHTAGGTSISAAGAAGGGPSAAIPQPLGPTKRAPVSEGAFGSSLARRTTVGVKEEEKRAAAAAYMASTGATSSASLQQSDYNYSGAAAILSPASPRHASARSNDGLENPQTRTPPTTGQEGKDRGRESTLSVVALHHHRGQQAANNGNKRPSLMLGNNAPQSQSSSESLGSPLASLFHKKIHQQQQQQDHQQAVGHRDSTPFASSGSSSPPSSSLPQLTRQKGKNGTHHMVPPSGGSVGGTHHNNHIHNNNNNTSPAKKTKKQKKKDSQLASSSSHSTALVVQTQHKASVTTAMTTTTTAASAMANNNDDLLRPMTESESILFHWFDLYDDVTAAWAFFGVNRKAVSQRKKREDISAEKAFLEHIAEQQRYRQHLANVRRERKEQLALKSRQRAERRQAAVDAQIDEAIRQKREREAMDEERRRRTDAANMARSTVSLLSPLALMRGHGTKRIGRGDPIEEEGDEADYGSEDYYRRRLYTDADDDGASSDDGSDSGSACSSSSSSTTTTTTSTASEDDGGDKCVVQGEAKRSNKKKNKRSKASSSSKKTPRSSYSRRSLSESSAQQLDEMASSLSLDTVKPRHEGTLVIRCGHFMLPLTVLASLRSSELFNQEIKKGGEGGKGDIVEIELAAEIAFATSNDLLSASASSKSPMRRRTSVSLAQQTQEKMKRPSSNDVNAANAVSLPPPHSPSFSPASFLMYLVQDASLDACTSKKDVPRLPLTVDTKRPPRPSSREDTGSPPRPPSGVGTRGGSTIVTSMQTNANTNKINANSGGALVDDNSTSGRARTPSNAATAAALSAAGRALSSPSPTLSPHRRLPPIINSSSSSSSKTMAFAARPTSGSSRGEHASSNNIDLSSSHKNGGGGENHDNNDGVATGMNDIKTRRSSRSTSVTMATTTVPHDSGPTAPFLYFIPEYIAAIANSVPPDEEQRAKKALALALPESSPSLSLLPSSSSPRVHRASSSSLSRGGPVEAARLELVDRLTNPNLLAKVASAHRVAAKSGGWARVNVESLTSSSSSNKKKRVSSSGTSTKEKASSPRSRSSSTTTKKSDVSDNKESLYVNNINLNNNSASPHSSMGVWALKADGDVETVSIVIKILAVVKRKKSETSRADTDGTDAETDDETFSLYEAVVPLPMSELACAFDGHSNVTISEAIGKALGASSSYEWASCPTLLGHKGLICRLAPTPEYADVLGQRSALVQLWAEPSMVSAVAVENGYLRDRAAEEEAEKQLREEEQKELNKAKAEAKQKRLSTIMGPLTSLQQPQQGRERQGSSTDYSREQRQIGTRASISNTNKSVLNDSRHAVPSTPMRDAARNPVPPSPASSRKPSLSTVAYGATTPSSSSSARTPPRGANYLTHANASSGASTANRVKKDQKAHEDRPATSDNAFMALVSARGRRYSHQTAVTLLTPTTETNDDGQHHLNQNGESSQSHTTSNTVSASPLSGGRRPFHSFSPKEEAAVSSSLSSPAALSLPRLAASRSVSPHNRSLSLSTHVALPPATTATATTTATARKFSSLAAQQSNEQSGSGVRVGGSRSSSTTSMSLVPLNQNQNPPRSPMMMPKSRVSPSRSSTTRSSSITARDKGNNGTKEGEKEEAGRMEQKQKSTTTNTGGDFVGPRVGPPPTSSPLRGGQGGSSAVIEADKGIRSSSATKRVGSVVAAATPTTTIPQHTLPMSTFIPPSPPPKTNSKNSKTAAEREGGRRGSTASSTASSFVSQGQQQCSAPPPPPVARSPMRRFSLVCSPTEVFTDSTVAPMPKAQIQQHPSSSSQQPHQRRREESVMEPHLGTPLSPKPPSAPKRQLSGPPSPTPPLTMAPQQQHQGAHDKALIIVDVNNKNKNGGAVKEDNEGFAEEVDDARDVEDEGQASTRPPTPSSAPNSPPRDKHSVKQKKSPPAAPRISASQHSTSSATRAHDHNIDSNAYDDDSGRNSMEVAKAVAVSMIEELIVTSTPPSGKYVGEDEEEL